jgi:hypothetical protein
MFRRKQKQLAAILELVTRLQAEFYILSARIQELEEHAITKQFKRGQL